MAMTLYVSSASPYSIKIWALMHFLELQPDIVFQNVLNRFTSLKRLGGQSMVPMLHVVADGKSIAIQDSTRIAEYLLTVSKTSHLPRDPGAAALALLIEDYADEWVVRWFASARWQGADAVDCGRRVGKEMLWNLPGIGGLMGNVIGKQIKETLKRGRVISDSLVLSHSRDRLLPILNTLFKDTPFIFGFEPTIADFALYGMIWQFRSDLTGKGLLKGLHNLNRFLDRMDVWRKGPVTLEAGPLRPLQELEPLINEIQKTYLAQLIENLNAKHAHAQIGNLTTSDGETLEFRATTYLNARLREHLQRFSDVYAEREHLLPPDGAVMEASLRKVVDALQQSEAGHAFLKDFTFRNG